MPEPRVIKATVRESGFEETEWIDIECRFSDGQKYTAVQVASEMPELATLIAAFLTAKEEVRQFSMEHPDLVRWFRQYGGK